MLFKDGFEKPRAISSSTIAARYTFVVGYVRFDLWKISHTSLDCKKECRKRHKPKSLTEVRYPSYFDAINEWGLGSQRGGGQASRQIVNDFNEGVANRRESQIRQIERNWSHNSGSGKFGWKNQKFSFSNRESAVAVLIKHHRWKPFLRESYLIQHRNDCFGQGA